MFWTHDTQVIMEQLYHHMKARPPPPPTDIEMDDGVNEKDLWYKDKGIPHSGISINVTYPHPTRRHLLAGESVEVCTTPTCTILEFCNEY